MAITRINHFEAKVGAEETLHAFLQTVVGIVIGTEGCISCRLLRSTENSACLAVIEEWDSIASHQQAAHSIPREKFIEAMALFNKPPTGMYYSD